MDPLPLLKDLIAIPSVNPMGRDLTGPQCLETRLTAYLVELFARHRIDCETIEVHPGRSNVVARIDRRGARRTILLDAHQDTVPVDGMTIDPFDPVERDGRVYGRGACDVKGGMAAMLAAMLRLAQTAPDSGSNVVMSCTVDEEADTTGITALTSLWAESAGRCKLLEHAPDVAIVAEPTGLDVVVAHRGATRGKLRTRGVACHSSRPGDGVNAIYRMAKILHHLQELADALPDLVTPHPLCGPATLSVGLIEGGVSVNTVPDECTIDLDRRVIPGEDGMQAIHDIEAWLRQRVDFDFEMLPPWLIGMTLSDDCNGALADELLACIEAVAGPHCKVGVPYGTHASRTSAAGVTSVVFGPGSIQQAHTVDEWINVDELRTAAEIYCRFCSE